MKVEEVSGTLGPFQVDATHKDWDVHTMWVCPVNSQRAGGQDGINVLITLIHRDLRDLQSVKKISMPLFCNTIPVITCIEIYM